MSEDATTEVLVEAVTGAAEAEESDQPPWRERAALATLVLGVLAALAATLGGMAANEATLERVHEAIVAVEEHGDRSELVALETKHEVLEAAGEEPPAAEHARMETLRGRVTETEHLLIEEEKVVQDALAAHHVLLASTTALAVAISMAGMSIVARGRLLWRASLVAGALGVLFFLWGLISFL